MTGIWPGLTQCTVNLGFDIDAQSNWIGRNPAFRNRPVVMTAADYGPKVGVRESHLMDEYGLRPPSSSGVSPPSSTDLVREIIARGHEVAGHGYMHLRPAELTLEDEIEDLDRGLEALEKAAGQKITGYRVPGGDASNRTMSLLAERGIIYDSSLMDDDAPYMIETPNGNVVQLPFHWLLDDFPYFAYVPAADMRGPGSSPASVARTWIAESTVSTQRPCMTGHAPAGHSIRPLAAWKNHKAHAHKPNVAITPPGHREHGCEELVVTSLWKDGVQCAVTSVST